MTMKIGKYDVIWTNLEENCGTITLIDDNGTKYSHYWGSMGGTIEQFLKQIDSEYFVDKLLGNESRFVADWRKTFRNIRTHIRDEIGLKWYEHLEFQSKMRYELNNFQQNCIEYDNDHYFVENFHYYLHTKLNFWLIEDKYDANYLDDEFKNISEVWYFIEKKYSPKYGEFIKLHKSLVKQLTKLETKSAKFLSKI